MSNKKIDLKKVLLYGTAGIILGAYFIKQGSYILEEEMKLTLTDEGEEKYAQVVNFPIGKTVYGQSKPHINMISNEFLPTNFVIEDMVTYTMIYIDQNPDNDPAVTVDKIIYDNFLGSHKVLSRDMDYDLNKPLFDRADSLLPKVRKLTKFDKFFSTR